MTTPQIHSSWLSQLADEFAKPYMAQLRQFLIARRDAGAVVYPPARLWFNTFNLTPFEEVKVVILGQDPYHGVGQAHGLSFSVLEGVSRPPSLENIFIEMESDLQLAGRQEWADNLTVWAKQGVLLLNSVLTVEQGRAGAHANKGWEKFTDAAIVKVAQKGGVVFILWGSYAQRKMELIDAQNNCVLRSVHPSPLSARRGFFGSKPFSRCNDYLSSIAQTPIQWQLPNK